MASDDEDAWARALEDWRVPVHPMDGSAATSGEGKGDAATMCVSSDASPLLHSSKLRTTHPAIFRCTEHARALSLCGDEMFPPRGASYDDIVRRMGRGTVYEVWSLGRRVAWVASKDDIRAIGATLRPHRAKDVFGADVREVPHTPNLFHVRCGVPYIDRAQNIVRAVLDEQYHLLKETLSSGKVRLYLKDTVRPAFYHVTTRARIVNHQRRSALSVSPSLVLLDDLWDMDEPETRF